MKPNPESLLDIPVAFRFVPVHGKLKLAAFSILGAAEAQLFLLVVPLLEQSASPLLFRGLPNVVVQQISSLAIIRRVHADSDFVRLFGLELVGFICVCWYFFLLNILHQVFSLKHKLSFPNFLFPFLFFLL